MSVVVGLAACAASSLAFGSMYVAVRASGDPGDGIVVQWIVCSAIFLSGLVTFVATGAPPFMPFAMLGGALWATGNLTAIPIIKTIGLGMGILIWGVVNCIVGWATGRFGLFGVKPSTPSSPNLNYIGLVLVIVGGILFAFVRPKSAENSNPIVANQPGGAPTMREASQPGTAEERESLVEEHGGEGMVVEVETATTQHQQQQAATAQTSEFRKRMLAIGFSLIAGICYGSTFTPVVYMQDNPEKFNNHPKDAIHYVFSHFAGCYLTSTAVLLVYIAYKQNKPFIDNRLIFPSFLAGILWAVAMLAWFVANDILSQAITFPINAMSPGVIASLWSVLYFKEVERKDIRLLVTAIGVTIFGVTLVGLSKSI